MNKVTHRYVRFFAPGSFVAETWDKAVNSLDPQLVEWPNNAYAFSLYEREDVTDGDATFTGKPKQIGPTYYHPDSKVETLEQVKENPKGSDILVRNMTGNGWKQIIWNRWGNWPQPFDPANAVIVRAAAATNTGAKHG